MSILRAIFSWFRGSKPAVRSKDEEDSPDIPAELPEVIDLGVTDTIDLHTFRPKEVPSVVREFLNAAVEAGITRVRIVHGKGIGVQRRIVREVLAKDPRVSAFSDASDGSGWGATVAELSRSTGPSYQDDSDSPTA